MSPLIYKDEVYTIVGFCIEIWKILGYGFSEVVYKDAMEQEFFDNNIPFIREDDLPIFYKGRKLKHKFNADFTVFDKIVIEVKSGEDGIIEKTIPQTLNYLRASGCKIGLIINFGKTGAQYKRLIM